MHKKYVIYTKKYAKKKKKRNLLFISDLSIYK